MLSGKNYISIGATIINTDIKEIKDENNGQEIEKPDNGHTLLYVFYNYTDNVAIEAKFDSHIKNVIHIENIYYHPPPLQEEIDKAVMLARKHPWISEKLCESLIGSLFLINNTNPIDKYYNHRQFEVRFCHDGERAPRLMAIIDLITETVSKVGYSDVEDHNDKCAN